MKSKTHIYDRLTLCFSAVVAAAATAVSANAAVAVVNTTKIQSFEANNSSK